MKLQYYPETDSLYIQLLKSAASVESYEVRDGLVVDLDDSGVAVGLEMEHLSYFIANSGADIGLEIQRRPDCDNGSAVAFSVDFEALHSFVDGLAIQETVDDLLRQPA